MNDKGQYRELRSRLWNGNTYISDEEAVDRIRTNNGPSTRYRQAISFTQNSRLRVSPARRGRTMNQHLLSPLVCEMPFCSLPQSSTVQMLFGHVTPQEVVRTLNLVQRV